MDLKRTLLSALMISQPCLSTGYDYIGKASKVDDLVTQQELQKSKIEVLEKQQGLDKCRIGHLEKQQTTIIDSTKMLAGMVRAVKDKQDELVLTKFNPTQTQYFILSNGSIDLARKIPSIDAVEDDSVIRISLVNLLSIPVSSMGFYVTWGGEKPTDISALAKQ